MASSPESYGVLNAGGIEKRWSEAVETEMIKKDKLSHENDRIITV